jgi:hypothetical protein
VVAAPRPRYPRSSAHDLQRPPLPRGGSTDPHYQGSPAAELSGHPPAVPADPPPFSRGGVGALHPLRRHSQLILMGLSRDQSRLRSHQHCDGPRPSHCWWPWRPLRRFWGWPSAPMTVVVGAYPWLVLPPERLASWLELPPVRLAWFARLRRGKIAADCNCAYGSQHIATTRTTTQDTVTSGGQQPRAFGCARMAVPIVTSNFGGTQHEVCQ